MSGNVSEWTQDWYDSGYYTGAGRTDPRGASAGIYRVDRGGSWYHTAEYQRVANRFYRTADDRSSQVGMRLARTIAPPAP